MTKHPQHPPAPKGGRATRSQRRGRGDVCFFGETEPVKIQKFPQCSHGHHGLQRGRGTCLPVLLLLLLLRGLNRGGGGGKGVELFPPMQKKKRKKKRKDVHQSPFFFLIPLSLEAVVLADERGCVPAPVPPGRRRLAQDQEQRLQRHQQGRVGQGPRTARGRRRRQGTARVCGCGRGGQGAGGPLVPSAAPFPGALLLLLVLLLVVLCGQSGI